MRFLLATHEVIWSRRDSYCDNQYPVPPQAEDFLTMPVRTQIKQLTESTSHNTFEKFNFSTGGVVE